MNDKERIKSVCSMIEDFILGKDCSLKFANKIEVELENVFPDDEEIQDFVSNFAMYEPVGGEYLYNAEEMIMKCKELLFVIKSRYSFV